jgi:signal peptidase
METIQQLKEMSKREFLSQLISLCYVICSALIIWKCLSLYTNCSSPIVVVLTGSMEPAFFRGDILFLSLSDEPIQLGDIVVYKLEGKDIPIVHRITRVHKKTNVNALSEHEYDQDLKYLTKGDANPRDDRFGIYNNGMEWLTRKETIGRVNAILPYIGMVTIIMNDYPYVKYIIIGILILLVLTNKE